MSFLVSACVLIRTTHGRYGEVVERIRQFKEVEKVFPVLGRWDAVASVEARDYQTLGALVVRMGRLSGVVFTETLVEIET
ncbi:MAG: Lrp/AsnC ligand binding domain-containing protein [Candidatus Bathyarchaeia archaeon]